MDPIDEFLLSFDGSDESFATAAQVLDANMRIKLYILMAMSFCSFWYYKCTHMHEIEAPPQGADQQHPWDIDNQQDDQYGEHVNEANLNDEDIDDHGLIGDDLDEAAYDTRYGAAFIGLIFLLAMYTTRRAMMFILPSDDGDSVDFLIFLKALLWSESFANLEFWVMTVAAIHAFGVYWYFYPEEHAGLLGDILSLIAEGICFILCVSILQIDSLAALVGEGTRKYYDEREAREDAESLAADEILH